MYELSLFSGAGGGLLATKWLLGWRTIGYVEWDDYCQRVLVQRIKDGLLDEAPIFGDIRVFIGEGYAKRYRGMVDVITAGFPCQPFSVAGKQKGKQDERNMWPQIIECIRIIRPRYAFLENVPGLLANEYIRRIYGDLAEAGYDARWCVLGADDCGANHRRKRLWILAYSKCLGWKEGAREGIQSKEQKPKRQNINNICEENNVANSRCGNKTECSKPIKMYFGRSSKEKSTNTTCRSSCNGEQTDVSDTEGEQNGRIQWQGIQSNPSTACNRRRETPWWATEPPLGRVAYGVAHRVDRLKAIGNGQVPAVVRAVWGLLNGF